MYCDQYMTIWPGNCTASGSADRTIFVRYHRPRFYIAHKRAQSAHAAGTLDIRVVNTNARVLKIPAATQYWDVATTDRGKKRFFNRLSPKRCTL